MFNVRNQFGTSLSTHISNFDDIGQCWIFAVLCWPFWKWWPVEIVQCQESIRDIIIYPHIKFWWYRPCWIFAVLWWPFWKWRPVENFQCRESIRDIIIYPHIKFWWYQTMLNFYHPYFKPCFGSHFENGRHLENFEMQNCSSIGDLSLCQILCLYHYPFRSYQH